MNAYRVFDADDLTLGTSYAATLPEAREIMRKTEPVFRARMRVQLIKIYTDKKHLVMLLNHGAPVCLALRTWRGTVKGGLQEITGQACEQLPRQLGN